MARFLRSNVAEVVGLGIVSSVLAAWVGQIIPSPVADGVWWRNLLFTPVPAFVLVSYSVFLAISVVLATNRWRSSDRAQLAEELEARRLDLASITAERDRLREEAEARRRSPVSADALMRFVAVALSDRGDGSPKTHLSVCQTVAGLAGEGVPHHDISDALGTMLHVGAVRSSIRKDLELASDWQDRLAKIKWQAKCRLTIKCSRRAA